MTLLFFFPTSNSARLEFFCMLEGTLLHVSAYALLCSLTYLVYPIVTQQNQKQPRTRTLFTLIISNSTLLLLQIFGGLRDSIFDLNLRVVFLLLLVIVPIFELNFLFRRILASTLIVVGAFVVFIGFDFESLVSKSCYFGALLAAIFSGYKTAEQVINTYFMVTVNDETIARMQKRLNQSVDLQFTLLKQNSDQISSHRMFVNNLFQEYDELLLLKDNKGFTWFGLLFTIYCAFRVISSSFNLMFATSNQQDLVTRIIDFIVVKQGYKINVYAWATNLSFLIVGAMGVSAVQSLLREFRKVSNNFIINSELIVVLITHCIGFYFLALLVTITRTLPPEYQKSTEFLFGHIDLLHFSKWCDAWFLVSSFSSSALYYLYLNSHASHF